MGRPDVKECYTKSIIFMLETMLSIEGLRRLYAIAKKIWREDTLKNSEQLEDSNED